MPLQWSHRVGRTGRKHPVVKFTDYVKVVNANSSPAVTQQKLYISVVDHNNFHCVGIFHISLAESILVMLKLEFIYIVLPATVALQ